MILPITIIGNQALRKKTKDIEENTEEIKKLIGNMFDTMYNADGVGLAAPQIGKSLRLFVIDASPFEEDDASLKDFKKAFINPKITEFFGEEVPFNEGCLSIPTIREDVKRPSGIKIQYLDENFEPHEETYEGIAARVIQHEYDHLEGILFTDKLTPLKRRLLKGKIGAVSKGKASVSYRTKLG